jgi:hypothetical protein
MSYSVRCTGIAPPSPAKTHSSICFSVSPYLMPSALLRVSLSVRISPMTTRPSAAKSTSNASWSRSSWVTTSPRLSSTSRALPISP